MQTCKKCAIEKELDSFKISRRHKSGRLPNCAECERAIYNKRKMKKDEDSSKYLASKLITMMKYNKDNDDSEFLQQPRVDDLQELITKSKSLCIYSGVQLEWSDDADIYHKGTFSRRNPDKGYEPGNIVICSVFIMITFAGKDHIQIAEELRLASMDQPIPALLVN